MSQQKWCWFLGIFLLGCLACEQSKIVRGKNVVDIPTLVNLPSVTNQNHLLVHGSKVKGTQILVHYVGDSNVYPPLTLVDNLSIWQGTIYLVPGVNEFTLQEKTASALGALSPVYSVLLDTANPNQPTYTGWPAFYLNGQITEVVALTGSKDANSLVFLSSTKNQGVLVGQADGSLLWSSSQTIVEGDNLYSLIATGKNGNSSPKGSFTVRGTNVPDPNIDSSSFKNPTNQLLFHIQGSQPANTHLYVHYGNDFVLQANADQLIQTSSNNTTSWALSLQLNSSLLHSLPTLAGNLIDLTFYDTMADNSFTGLSAGVRLRVVYKTWPPPPITAPVILNGLTASALSEHVTDFGVTTKAFVTLTGTLPLEAVAQGASVCVQMSAQPFYDAGAACLVQALPYNTSGDFNVQLPLYAGLDGNSVSGSGNNYFFVTDIDAAGNLQTLGATANSTPVGGKIYRVSPAWIDGNVTVPLDGSLLVGDPFNSQDSNNQAVMSTLIHMFSDDVLRDPSDTTMKSLQMCFANSCQSVAGITQQSTDIAYSTTFSLSTLGLSNGHVYPFVITAINATQIPSVLNHRVVYSTGVPIWLSDTQNGLGQNQASSQAAILLDASGTVHVAWSDSCVLSTDCNVLPSGSQSTAPDIFYRSRDSNGLWSQIRVISSLYTDDGQSTQPSLAMDALGQLHIAWVDTGPVIDGSTGQSKPSGQGIVHRFIRSNGDLSDVAVVGQPQQGIWDRDVQIVQDSCSQLLYASWTRSNSSLSSDIMVASYNGSWSVPTAVSDSGYSYRLAQVPSMAALPQGGVQIAWQECRSAAPIGLNYNPNTNDCQFGSNANHLLVNDDIYTKALSASLQPLYGENQSLKVSYLPRGINNADGDSVAPSLVVDSNAIAWVFWQDAAKLYGQNRRNIWLVTFDSNQATAQNGNLSNPSQYSLISGGSIVSASAVRASYDKINKNIAVAWLQQDDANSLNIWASNTSDLSRANIIAQNGSASISNSAQLVFQTPVAQANALASNGAPAVALSDLGDMHVVWQSAASFSNPVINPANSSNQAVLGIFYNYVMRR